MPLRILHLADVHIGVENYGRPTTEEDVAALPSWFSPGMDRSGYVGFSTRLVDFLSTLDEAVEYSLASAVDVVLFAGDAYRSRDPSQTHQREFARRVARLANNGIQVFLLSGNHDAPHVSGRASALEIFPTLDVRNVHAGEHLATHVIITRQGPIQIVALPWVRRSAFLAREEMRELTLEQITEHLQERLTLLLQDQVEKLDSSIPAILCGHVTVSSARLSSERGMMLGNDHVLLLSTIANPAFDYVALGHIHRHQVLSHNPLVVYSGSLQRVDFSEEEDEKGFCVVELDMESPPSQRLVSFDFHKVAARPFATIKVTVRDGQDPTESVLQAIERQHVDGKIVRVQVTMSGTSEPLFREREVRSALHGAHHIAAIERQIQRDRRSRLSEKEVERISPKEALQKYLDSRGVPKERARTLFQHGERLIRDELQDTVSD